MTDQALAAIIAAFITAVGALIAANFEQITQLLRRSSRNVTGHWTIATERVVDGSWVGEYHLKLRQTGTRVRGEMVATKVTEGKQGHNHRWSGKVVNEYLMYECSGTDPGTFMISSGILYIHPNGEGMDGYFVANRGFKSPEATWVGYTKLGRKK